MSAIHEAKLKIAAFFEGELEKDPQSVRFLKLAKSDGGWKGTVEVTELNEYLKKIGYPPIFDKNLYKVVLDEDFNVIQYGRTTPEEEEE